MAGEPMPVFDKQEMSAEDLRMLQQLQTLSQNPALFYGSGVKAPSAYTPKQVERFESRLKRALEATGMYGFEEQALDLGRYSRLSRTMTPGSPILEVREEDEAPPPTPLPALMEDAPPLETFLTEQQKSTN